MDNAGPKKRFRLLAVGVGGQGVLTITRFIGEAAMSAGLEVVVGQLHGMSQRGGSVSSAVLIGPGKSSFVADGQADVVLGLEPLETLRALPAMAGHTKVVMNLGRVMPGVLARQGKPYPAIEGIVAQIRAVAASVHTVDSGGAAERLGGAQGLNVVMLGALSGFDLLPVTEEQLVAAIEKRSGRRSLERNRRAFAFGKESVKK
jgi:indolepyruvate ferredoxin oxidoreductase beta subunit